MHYDEMLHGPIARRRPRIESETPLLPEVIAAAVLEEASVWLGVRLPRKWIGQMTIRAEAAYEANARFRGHLKERGNAGRDWLWAFSRHWLSALIERHRPDLFRRLPEVFLKGGNLPKSRSAASSRDV